VLQGEREMAAQNRTLGRFDLVGIPPAPRGVPQIEVAFDIDANGIVHVSAKDLGTGKEQKIRIESSSGLSEGEIDRMVKDAEAHAEEDRKSRESAEVRNEADSLVYTTEKSLVDYGEKISDEDRSKIEAAIAELKTALESGDFDQIKEKSEALKQASFTLAEEVYKSAQAEAEAQGEGSEEAAYASGDSSEAADQTSGESKSDDAEDIDYEVVDEDENT
jgi:molecular chaperone DnaK